MAIGPGKYDDLCTYVREQAQAAGAILIILDGRLGSGFACQASIEATLKLPELLEEMARQLRADRDRGEMFKE